MAISGVSSQNLISSVQNAVTAKASGSTNNAAELLGNAASLLNTLGKMVGTAGNQNVAKQPSVSSLFGNNALEAANEENNQKARSIAASGGKMSLGALLALIGGILVKSIEQTMDKLAKAAQELDGLTKGGGPTAAKNQEIQELTFNLQQIQQTLNRVNETVTNLSRSASDAQKTTAQNLSV